MIFAGVSSHSEPRNGSKDGSVRLTSWTRLRKFVIQVREKMGKSEVGENTADKNLRALTVWWRTIAAHARVAKTLPYREVREMKSGSRR